MLIRFDGYNRVKRIYHLSFDNKGSLKACFDNKRGLKRERERVWNKKKKKEL